MYATCFGLFSDHHQACKYETPTKEDYCKTSVTYFVWFLGPQKKNIFLKSEKRSADPAQYLPQHIPLSALFILYYYARCFVACSSDIHIGRRGTELEGRFLENSSLRFERLFAAVQQTWVTSSMFKDYGKYCHPKTVNCMNGVSVYDFLGNPITDPFLYIVFLVGYC
jgi:hypothetical protein